MSQISSSFRSAWRSGGKDLSLAVSQQQRQINNVTALAKKYGVADRDFQTDRIAIRPVYDDREEVRTLVHYAVSRGAAITLREPSRFDSLITALIQAGVNNVLSIGFRTSELRKHKDRARELAIIAAREKAAALAATLGQKIGRAYSIEEEPEPLALWGGANGFSNSAAQAPSFADSESAGGLALGQISVTARVKVQFELQ